jgi:hypothetical protein
VAEILMPSNCRLHPPATGVTGLARCSDRGPKAMGGPGPRRHAAAGEACVIPMWGWSVVKRGAV